MNQTDKTKFLIAYFELTLKLYDYLHSLSFMNKM